MRIPRDTAGNTKGLVRAARTISNIISPPVIFAVMGLALALYELPSWEGLLWAAIYGFWVSLVPSLLVGYLLKTGRISDLHMSNTKERRWPYVTSVIGSIIALFFIQLFDGPELLRCLAIFSIIELTALGVITNFWLISIHATAMAAATVISGLVFGWWTLIILVPLTAAVCFLRLFLRRHDVAQVAAGLVLGIGTVLILVQLGCF
jgi:membrane-associated phospholipid phosphatase